MNVYGMERMIEMLEQAKKEEVEEFKENFIEKNSLTIEGRRDELDLKGYKVIDSWEVEYLKNGFEEIAIKVVYDKGKKGFIFDKIDKDWVTVVYKDVPYKPIPHSIPEFQPKECLKYCSSINDEISRRDFSINSSFENGIGTYKDYPITNIEVISTIEYPLPKYKYKLLPKEKYKERENKVEKIKEKYEQAIDQIKKEVLPKYVYKLI